VARLSSRPPSWISGSRFAAGKERQEEKGSDEA